MKGLTDINTKKAFDYTLREGPLLKREYYMELGWSWNIHAD